MQVSNVVGVLREPAQGIFYALSPRPALGAAHYSHSADSGSRLSGHDLAGLEAACPRGYPQIELHAALCRTASGAWLAEAALATGAASEDSASFDARRAGGGGKQILRARWL